MGSISTSNPLLSSSSFFGSQLTLSSSSSAPKPIKSSLLPSLLSKQMKFQIIQSILNKKTISKSFIFRGARGPGGPGGLGGPMDFETSKSKFQKVPETRMIFEYVTGADQAKLELQEVVDFLKNPDKYTALGVGAKIPKGCLLVGPPGTKKTRLARAVAGEAGVPFFSCAASESVELFVGDGASRVQDSFEKAKSKAPCIVFIDEIDVVGRQRGAGMGGGNDEREQTINQLLTEMDGLSGNSGVIVLAATNRPDVLDSALLRPGRFDRQVTVDGPDVSGRVEVLQLLSSTMAVAKDVDFDKIARKTPGFTVDDLSNLMNEAVILAARRELEEISMDEISDALERIIAGSMDFGRSKSKFQKFQKVPETSVIFAYVTGADQAKLELQEVVDFLKNPDKNLNIALEAKIPKGCLLVGRPGTGKTLLARAVAGEAGVPFFSCAASQFVELSVGVGASRVRELFEKAKSKAPCIVFIDKIDAVGRQRGAGMGGGNDEREQTINQLLTEMDGLSGNSGVIVLAATNRPDVLDSALLRPGRFDRQVTVDGPDVSGRVEVLQLLCWTMAVAKDVDFDKIARKTPGFTLSDLSNLMNEALILAARRELEEISMDEISDALERIIAGPEKKNAVVSDAKKKLGDKQGPI